MCGGGVQQSHGLYIGLYSQRKFLQKKNENRDEFGLRSPAIPKMFRPEKVLHLSKHASAVLVVVVLVSTRYSRHVILQRHDH